MKTMKVNYDKRYDTLYVAFADKSNSYGDDTVDGLIVMRDLTTDEITGLTILRFLSKYREGDLPVLPSELHCSVEELLPLIKDAVE